MISRIGQLSRFKTAHSANPQPADFADLIPQISLVADLVDPHTRNLRICGIDEIKAETNNLQNLRRLRICGMSRFKTAQLPNL